MKRVANTESELFYRASSLKSFRDYWEQACKYADVAKISTILDWGCGCGRLIGCFLKLTEISGIYGCDIDAEAIEWCKGQYSQVNFTTILPHPPTQYPDNVFDLAIGNSVFTHLTRDIQIAWLGELMRIMKPGGLFLASVHGEFATYFSFPNSAKIILKNGIYDDSKDHNLDDIAPPGYYRGTFQSMEYTRKIFGRYFEILKYVERGATNYQDLVIMRKPK
jgi:SAM-dependent methyltransferase